MVACFSVELAQNHCLTLGTAPYFITEKYGWCVCTMFISDFFLSLCEGIKEFKGCLRLFQVWMDVCHAFSELFVPCVCQYVSVFFSCFFISFFCSSCTVLSFKYLKSEVILYIKPEVHELFKATLSQTGS